MTVQLLSCLADGGGMLTRSVVRRPVSVGEKASGRANSSSAGEGGAGPSVQGSCSHEMRVIALDTWAGRGSGQCCTRCRSAVRRARHLSLLLMRVRVRALSHWPMMRRRRGREAMCTERFIVLAVHIGC